MEVWRTVTLVYTVAKQEAGLKESRREGPAQRMSSGLYTYILCVHAHTERDKNGERQRKGEETDRPFSCVFVEGVGISSDSHGEFQPLSPHAPTLATWNPSSCMWSWKVLTCIACSRLRENSTNTAFHPC